MLKIQLILLLFISSFFLKAQIIIDNNPPYDNPSWLVDNVLLGGGVIASNHSYQGANAQIGWFNGVNTSLGLDSGIILSTGDIYLVDPINIGNGITMPPVAVADPDLLNVANSVPGLIGQTFSVSSVNDIAVLEFDFIPTSDSISFRYVFGSEEYFGFENTQYNDVFGFFLSGPGIAGPYANGSINLAVIPNSVPELPVTISSVNSVTPINQQYFVDNTLGLDTIANADGLTTVFTAKALVQCNETYHIRLAIADGVDGLLDSYVWLEAGSFSSPVLEVIDDLGIDSTIMEIPCNSVIKLTANGGIGATYQWFDSTNVLLSTDSFVFVGAGTYWVEASSFGCPVTSDTLKVVSQDGPIFDLGIDYTIDCNTSTVLDPLVTGGLGQLFYQYIWTDINLDSIISSDTFVVVDEGIYSLYLYDLTGCYYTDTIEINEEINPTTIISGGGSICDDGSILDISFSFSGLTPWSLTYSDGSKSYFIDNIINSDTTIQTSLAGTYIIDSVLDINGCLSNKEGLVDVIVHPLPSPSITPAEITIYIGDFIELDAGDFLFYEWYILTDTIPINYERLLRVTEADSFYVWVEDTNGCANISDTAFVYTQPLTQLFVPNAFSPNGDENNELFVIQALNITYFNIVILNRWGQEVFTSNSIDKYWDGFFETERVPEGTYYYQIEVLGLDGKIFNQSGSLQVIY